jgi:hypothetical protein
MKIRVQEVNNNSSLKRFVAFPFSLYAGHKYWVPPMRLDEIKTLRKDKNPAFDFCEAKYWLAWQDKRLVGRIAGIINHKFNQKTGKNYLRFGWIDFIDDQEVTQALFAALDVWGKERNMQYIHGPLGFTDMDNEGMLIEGFEELGTLATIYNYPYYPVHLEKIGFQKDTDWLEYELIPPQQIPEKISRLAEGIAKRYDLHLLKVKKAREILPYAHQIFEVLNSAYDRLYGFVPLTEKQIDYYVKQYFSFIVPEYVPVVLDRDDKVVAFGITMPSVSRALQKCRGRLFPFGIIHLLKAMKNNPDVDLYLTAVRPDMQNKGVNAMLINEMNKIYVRNKIRRVESNPELEDNQKIQAQWKLFTSRQHKRRRCYIKEIV